MTRTSRRLLMPGVALALVALAGLLLVLVSGGPDKSEPAKLHAAHFRTFDSPQGRFTVSIPAGWEFQAFAEDESSIGFTPTGKGVPEVSIAFTEASTAAAQMGLQGGEQYYSSRLSAQEFLEQVFFPLLEQRGVTDLKSDSIKSSDQSAAEATISGSYQGREGEAKIVCTMDYVEDSTLPPSGGWYSFAYLNMVVARPDELSAAEPVASEIFRSFHPTDKWMGEVMTQIAEGMQTRGAIISGSVERLNAMEMQQRMSEMQSNTDIGQGWIDALGGTTEVTDPESGDAWRVDDDYNYYFEEGGDVFGTDDPADLNLPGRHALEG